MYSQPSLPASARLADYGALLGRRWRLIASITLCGLLLGVGVLSLRPSIYTASTSVLVSPTGIADPTPVENALAPADINLDTEAAIATSTTVARQARKIRSMDASIDRLRENAFVTVPPNSAILEISYRAPTPRAARRGAQAFATAYLKHRKEVAERRVTRHVAALRERIATQSSEIASISSRISAAPAGTSASLLARARRGLLTQQLSALRSRVSELATATVSSGSIISAARLPTQPSGPSTPLHATTGLMAGLLAGLAAAQLRDRTDTRIRSSADVGRLTGLPVLLDLHDRKHRNDAAGLAALRSQTGQAFHALSRSLTTTLGHGRHLIVVTGPTPGSGASVVATNLAAALARAGSATLLVCADFAYSRATALLDLREQPGLSDALLDRAQGSEVEQRVSTLPRLRAIPPGTRRDEAVEKLQLPVMSSLLRPLRRSATYVIVEAPATSAGADAQALAEEADAALVTVEVPRAEQQRAREGLRQLGNVGTAVLGAIVLPSDSGNSEDSDDHHRETAP